MTTATRGQARALYRFGFGWFAFGITIGNCNATAFKNELGGKNLPNIQNTENQYIAFFDN
ncbi:MAG: hypothetical protein EAZ95_18725 [Bacteroidetes bacterium]|nr:MAG: hypothetical protein EAZ95_18725 [Bacteroidota bacterium]